MGAAASVPLVKQKRVAKVKSRYKQKTNQSVKGLAFFPDCDFSKYNSLSPNDLFELFFHDNLFNFILEQSN